MKEKMLVIPGGFLPYNDPITLISYKHLRLLDYDFDVVALSNTVDKSIQKELEKDVNYKKFNVKYVAKYDDTIATLQRKNVISGVFNIFKYIKECLKQSKKEDYSVIYSSSVPSFTHVAAYFIKRKNKNIKWIASFSDPLYKSPYKKDDESFKDYSIVSKIGFYVYTFIYMNGMYEKIAMKYADKIVYICEEQRDFMINNYENSYELKEKAVIVPLNYIEDWDLYREMIGNNTTSNECEKVVFSHFGRIYGLRKIDSLLQAISELNSEIIDFDKIFLFEQYGEIIERYQNKINEYKISHLFNLIDKVSYEQALIEMHKCGCLVLCDTIIDDDLIQPYLPSKTLDYLLMKKACLVITTKLSPAYRIFNDKCFNCCLNDVQMIKNEILNIINNRSIKDYSMNEYENEAAIKDLKDYLK